MIVVFIPSLILEIFTANFLVKLFIFNLSVTLWTVIQFIYWNLMLVLPKVLSIYISELTVNRSKELRNHIKKYSSVCLNDINQREMKNLANKFINYPVKFSCGFFEFNLQMGLSILSTIATYLIIVCQFESNQEA